MPEFENVRTTAEAIGRITCINTGREIGVLYRWDNGETQAALYGEVLSDEPNHAKKRTEPPQDAYRR